MDKVVESRLGKVPTVHPVSPTQLKDVRGLGGDPLLVTALPSQPAAFSSHYISTIFHGAWLNENSVLVAPETSGTQSSHARASSPHVAAVPEGVDKYLTGSYPRTILQNLSVPEMWKSQFLTPILNTVFSTSEANSLTISLP